MRCGILDLVAAMRAAALDHSGKHCCRRDNNGRAGDACRQSPALGRAAPRARAQPISTRYRPARGGTRHATYQRGNRHATRRRDRLGRLAIGPGRTLDCATLGDPARRRRRYRHHPRGSSSPAASSSARNSATCSTISPGNARVAVASISSSDAADIGRVAHNAIAGRPVEASR